MDWCFNFLENHEVGIRKLLREKCKKRGGKNSHIKLRRAIFVLFYDAAFRWCKSGTQNSTSPSWAFEFYSCGFLFSQEKQHFCQDPSGTFANEWLHYHSSKKRGSFLPSSSHDLKPQFWFKEELPLIPHELPFAIAQKARLLSALVKVETQVK